jgi:hypothetical protein
MCNLTVELSSSYITSCVYDTINNEFIYFEKNNDSIALSSIIAAKEFKDFISENDLLKNQFKNTTFLIRTQGCTLVPLNIYNQKYQSSYIEFNNPLEPEFIVNSDILQSINLVNIYKIQTDLKNAVLDFNPHARILHSSSALIKGLFSIFKNKMSETTAFVNISSAYFDMIIISTEGLVFYNSFKYKTAEDLLYYVLFVFEQLKLKPLLTPLYLSGDIETDSLIFELLYKYIGKLYILKHNTALKYSYALDTIQEHYYFSLFNSELCE